LPKPGQLNQVELRAARDDTTQWRRPMNPVKLM
jgi:hypothetical protein